MEKPTTKLSAQDRVILFCVATGVHHTSVGITDHAMPSMPIRGFIAHNRELFGEPSIMRSEPSM
jgi:hypothetical protein